jgi:hypothetical protein
MTVWRIKLNPMRTADQEGGVVDWDEAKRYAREASIVGVGWGIPGVKDGASLQDVLAAVMQLPDGKAGRYTIARLANQVEDGDLLWTRDGLGRFWLGQVAGPWRYDRSPGSVRFDFYNLRPCHWLDKSFRDYEVPGAVGRSFTGHAWTLARIGNHPVAIRISEMMWARESDPSTVIPPVAPAQAISDLLDPIDVEDVVLLYLQYKGWLLLPSTRMHDTPMYEAALRHPDTGQVAVVSVKSGSSNPVDIPKLAEAAGSAQAYAYSTHGMYIAPPSQHGVIEIPTSELVSFMAEHTELLPPRVSRWLMPEPS